MRKTIVFASALMLLFSCVETGEKIEEQNAAEETPVAQETPMVYLVMQTSAGDITLELNPERAPVTVDNFLQYVESDHYDNTIFHRVISNFMIQGGGFTPAGEQKETMDPIILEDQNGLTNEVGTIAMARTPAPNSATSQFFINVQNNASLNGSPARAGYAVFGKVIDGMDVVNTIRMGETAANNGMNDWPVEPVVIQDVYKVEVQ